MKEIEWTIALQLGPDILYPNKSGSWQKELNADVIVWNNKNELKLYAKEHINTKFKWVLMPTLIESIIY